MAVSSAPRRHFQRTRHRSTCWPGPRGLNSKHCTYVCVHKPRLELKTLYVCMRAQTETHTNAHTYVCRHAQTYYLPTYLPTYPPTHPPTYLPTDLQTNNENYQTPRMEPHAAPRALIHYVGIIHTRGPYIVMIEAIKATSCHGDDGLLSRRASR